MARVVQDPFEAGTTTALTGWIFSGVNAILSGFSRQLNGQGGTHCVRGATSTQKSAATPPLLTEELNHFHYKCGMYLNGVSTSWWVRWVNGAFALTGSIGTTNGGTLRAYRDSTEIADSGWVPTTGRWYLIEIEVYLHDTLGFFKVWADGVLRIDFSGDTRGSGGAASWQCYGEQYPYWDDIGVNSISLRWDSESMPFNTGETITGATSGATAVITSLVDNGTSGVFTLENWNEIPFQDNESITSAMGVANVDAPTGAFINGFEPNSGRMGNEFIQHIPPNAVGNSSELGLVGTTGVAATETLTTSSIPLNNETVTIAGKVYTYKTAAPALNGDVLIGASQATAMENLRRAINLDGVGGTNYALIMSLNPSVSATDTGTTVVVTAFYNGTYGNSIALAEGLTNGSWGGAATSLSGGTGENYQGVDEVPGVSTDRVEANVANLKDTYGGNIDGVLPISINITYMAGIAVVKSALTGVDNIQHVVRIGGADFNSSSKAIGTSDSQVISVFPTNPSTNAPWLRNEIAVPTFEFGIELKA
jgi:hypothetical protein